VITENDLPKLTGVDLVKRLRAARMPVPMVMAAGKLPTDELARNPPLRAAATLAMPFPVESLLAAVRKILSTPDDPRPK
jgi:DNA-binding NtrC family response regulator